VTKGSNACGRIGHDLLAIVDETRSFARASPLVIDFAQEHRGRASA